MQGCRKRSSTCTWTSVNGCRCSTGYWSFNGLTVAACGSVWPSFTGWLSMATNCDARTPTCYATASMNSAERKGGSTTAFCTSSTAKAWRFWHMVSPKKKYSPLRISSGPSNGKNAMSKTHRSTEQSSRPPKSRTTSDALEILDQHVIRDDAKLREEVKQAQFELEVAQLIYNARTAAGLTQAELADLVGTNQSVISRLEDADYEGHSLSMLRRVAQALGKRLDVRFLPMHAARST